MITALLILAMGFADRLRGTTHPWAFTSKLLYGFIACGLLGLPGWWLLGGAALFALGSATGWSRPLTMALGDSAGMDQARLHWYQVGPMKYNPHLALMVRGLIWGAPISLLAFWHPVVLAVPVAYAIATPLAPWLALRYTPGFLVPWEAQESCRGWVGGLIISGAILCFSFLL